MDAIVSKPIKRKSALKKVMNFSKDHDKTPRVDGQSNGNTNIISMVSPLSSSPINYLPPSTVNFPSKNKKIDIGTSQNMSHRSSSNYENNTICDRLDISNGFNVKKLEVINEREHSNLIPKNRLVAKLKPGMASSTQSIRPSNQPKIKRNTIYQDKNGNKRRTLMLQFCDDECNKQGMEMMGNPYYFQSFEANYNLKNYFEFVFYHIAFFLFGYCLMPFVLPFKRTRIIFINMQFVKLGQGFFSQIIFWITTLVCILCYMLFETPLTNISSLILCLTSVVLRSSNIAAKYATFPEKQLKKYREQVLTGDEIRSNFLLGAWRDQKIDIVEREVDHAIQRNGFDDSVFHLSFLSSPNPKTEELIDKVRGELESDISKKNYIEARRKEYYSGKLIFYVIVRKFNDETSKTLFMNPKNIFLAILWGFLPMTSRLVLGLSIVSKEGILDDVSFWMNMLACSMLYFLTNLFYIQAKVDIQRSIYVMQQLSHLISSQKLSTETEKLLPTINFLEEFSMNSWKIMRRITIDYGKNYFHRHEIYLPVIFVIACVCYSMIFILQVGTNRISLDQRLGFDLRENQIVLGVMAGLCYWCTFSLLLSFSKINEFFEIHILKLYKVKQTLSDLLKYSDFYFKDSAQTIEEIVEMENKEMGIKEESGESKEELSRVINRKKMYQDTKTNSNVGSENSKYVNTKNLYNIDINEIFKIEKRCNIHRRLVLEIMHLMVTHKDLDLTMFLQHNIQSIDNIIDEIAVDQKYQSIEIIGFIISRNFTFNLMIVLLSVSVTAYELFI